ncbi:hypothetical protein [Paenibacillus sp. OSY-SE]|uniref:hypothetical protein n=1 Tax=Paenibacillus sp. OSY-SE TaxID=1196323 RepID=UPI0012FC542A|nr:hypothetical protein [Paenibacillus sp. OSY-SE]
MFKLDELTLDDCIRLANELAEKEYEHWFIELWIAEQTEWSKENLTQLRYWEQYRGNLQG